MEMLWQHTHYAARTLFMKPGFTLVVIFTLALGAGANTAIFSVANAAALTPTFAQSATATLSGAVVDEAGAVVAGAKIELTNPGTALKRVATTSGEGYFTFALLPPGTYTLQALREGFAPVEVRNVVLNVNDQLAIKIQMKVAQVGATVNVVDSAALTREEPAVSTVVDRQFVENQPLNGRSFQSLITLAPGIVLTKGGVGTQGQFSVNGQRASSNYFTIDGVSANFGTNSTATLYEQAGGGAPAYSALGSTNTLASVDAVQEFKIQTSTYAPEFGREPGAQVQVVTRSGTNEIRGNLFEYFRNDLFDANDFFANRNRLGKPALRQNDFGAVLGGPVYLPKKAFGPLGYDGRNRTFFFFSYEGLRLRQPQVTDPIRVPSLLAREKATGVARDLLSAWPLPNGPALPDDPNTATFAASYSNPSSIDAASVRLDHTFNSRLTVFGRYNNAPSEIRTGLLGPSTFPSLTETTTVGATGLISPRVSNDLRVNYSRAKTSSRFRLDNVGGSIVPPDAALFPPFANSETGFSFVQIGAFAYSQGFNAENRQRQFNVVDNLSWTAGTHALKFGADYRQLNPVNKGALYRRFLFFDNVSQVVAGVIPSGSATLTDVVFYPRYHNFSAFAQDTWRATRRFTLTYGLRYEVNPAPTEKDDNLPYTASGLDDPAKLKLNPKGTRFYETTWNNFAPRVGMAYQIVQTSGRETALRGGFGVYYDLGYTFTGSAFTTTFYPYGRTIDFVNTPLNSPLLNAPLPPFNPAPSPPYQRIFAYEDGYKLPYTLQYNVTVEQSLGAASAVTISYVGAAGRRLGRAERYRNPAPDFTRIDAVRNSAESNYNAVQAQYQRRLSRGLQMLASYTFSKSIDTVSDESITNFQAPVSRLDPRQDYGPSSFDVRHVASGAVSYDIPSPFANGAGRALLGGFGVDTIFTARTATPVNALTGTDPFGLGFTSVTRPDLVPGQPLYVDDESAPGGRRFNRAAFVNPPAGKQGTLGRNALRGFPLAQLDLSLRRRFKLTERADLQFRADAFNIFNHPNFADPVGVMADPNFGRSTQMLGRNLSGGTGLSPLYQVGGPRSLQFSLKLQF
jgi:carboxypeptidase family protein/TonB-dependent receptor-like protein